MNQRKKMYLPIIFLLLFSMSMCVLLLLHETDMPYDAGVYLAIGKSCGWDIRNMYTGFRGWLFPYTLFMCYKFGRLFGSDYFGIWVMTSTTYAVIFTIVFRCIAKILGFGMLNKRSLSLGGAICGIVFYIYFRGLFIYTLSDFYAFSLSLIDVILIYDILNSERKLRMKFIEAYILGLGMYGAYNIRTIYLFLLVSCILVLVIWQLCEKKWKQLAATFVPCVLGMFSCSIPQIISNHHLYGSYSWKVPAEGLMLSQISWGISWERYATYMGDLSEYGSRSMYFVDHIGQSILESAQITEFTSYGQFVKLVLSYPLDFLGVYIRHFLNMLYPIYPNQYIFDVTKDKTLLLLIFYSLLFLAVSNFISSFELKSSKWVWFCLILVPCICILPGAVEIRFFVALHFLIYMYAVLGSGNFIVRFRQNKVRYIITYLVGFGLYIAYAGAMLGTTMQGTATIH